MTPVAACESALYRYLENGVEDDSAAPVVDTCARATLDMRDLDQSTMQRAAEDRIWSEWLSRYLAHCRRELNGPELEALASSIDRAIRANALPDLGALVSERVSKVARPLVDFIATAPSSEARMALAREAAIRLRAAARSR